MHSAISIMGSEDRTRRSKNLGTHSGFTDGNGSSRHGIHLDSELCGESGISKHSEVANMTVSSDHFDIKPEVIEGKGSTNPFEICPEVDIGDENSMLLETHPAVSDRNHSSKNMVMHPAATFNGSDLVLPTKSLRLSSSCSSSASSLEDLFRVDTGSLRSFVQQASKDDEINVPNSNSSKSKAQDKWSPGPTSTSEVSQVTYDVAPTQSPPFQVMDRAEGYDPLRIPSSIFERSKSSTQLEWSAASNESLFSIHIGNNSFSRDLFKSGELTKSGELNLNMFNPSPPIPEVGADKEGAEFEKSRASVESIKDVTRETRADRSQEKAPAAAALQNPSHISNHSNDSTHSFAFPIVKKKKCACISFFCCRKKCRRKKCAWPSCYFSNCSCTFCYCSWPSCYFRWLSCYCSNCSWAFCYCWNCSLKRWCCHSSTTLTDRIKSVSMKPDVNEKHPQKPLPTELSSKSSCCCCWFSCFSCRLRCCCSS